MRLRERTDTDPQVNADGTPPIGGNLEQLHAAGQSFISVGMETISRVMSQDNPAYLQSTRQQGGQ